MSDIISRPVQREIIMDRQFTTLNALVEAIAAGTVAESDALDIIKRDRLDYAAEYGEFGSSDFSSPAVARICWDLQRAFMTPIYAERRARAEAAAAAPYVLRDYGRCQCGRPSTDLGMCQRYFGEPGHS